MYEIKKNQLDSEPDNSCELREKILVGDKKVTCCYAEKGGEEVVSSIKRILLDSYHPNDLRK